MQDRIDAIAATPPAVVTGLHIFGLPINDVVMALNLCYIIVLLWLKLPEIIKRARKKGGSSGCTN